MDATVVPISLILWAVSASDPSDPPVETSARVFLLTSLLSVCWVFKAVLTAAGPVYSWRVDRGVGAELRNNSNLILQVSVSHVWWTLARYKQTHLHWSVRPVSWQQFTKQLKVSSAAVCCGGCKQAVGWYVGCCCWWVWVWVIFQALQHTCEKVLMDNMFLPPSIIILHTAAFTSRGDTYKPKLAVHASVIAVKHSWRRCFTHGWKMLEGFFQLKRFSQSLRQLFLALPPPLFLSLISVFMAAFLVTSCGKIIGCVLTPGC